MASGAESAYQPIIDDIGTSAGQLFSSFLMYFMSAGSGSESQSSRAGENPHYVGVLNTMLAQDMSTLYVDFTHVAEHDHSLAGTILEYFQRIEGFLCQSVFNFVRELHPDQATGHNSLERRFFVSFYNLPSINTIRDLRTHHLGRLQSISGTVTRTSQSRPELITGVFRCVDCGVIIRNVQQQFKYTEPTICTNSGCNNRKKFAIETAMSSFSDWQQLRLQENAEDIPAGSMPRTLTVILRNELVELAKPGDKVYIAGCLIVVPDLKSIARGAVSRPEGGSRVDDADGVRGLKELGVKDQVYKLCYLASNVTILSAGGPIAIPRNLNFGSSADAVLGDFTSDERRIIVQMKKDPKVVDKIIRSFAPNIYGHQLIKKGVLLMLLGGVHKRTADGTNLRGDINVCIVGDPSTSKSQFLKYACAFTTRAVYTSGKASSAAGLTASVARDVETGEYTIEAGALMLADNGICCIDEFDKMDAKDQSAIHEAMEQQTISITKAGIQATLNARAAILAAANPIGGRYDRTKSLRANLEITPPIMSRFDQFFVVVDECDAQIDRRLAEHIILQRRQRASEQDNGQVQSFVEPPEYSKELLQIYVRFARSLNPVISDEAKQELVKQYDILRSTDSANSATNSSYRITVRQLESLVRLSEALARLHLEEVITVAHVIEASKLLKESVVKVVPKEIDLMEEDNDDSAAPPPPSSRGGNASYNEEEEDDEEDSAQGGPQKKRKIAPIATAKSKKATYKISHADYKRYSRMILIHLRNVEYSIGSDYSLSRADVEQWLLNELLVLDPHTAPEQLKLLTKLTRLVLHSMITKDKSIVTLDDRVGVHPNYVLDMSEETQVLDTEIPITYLRNPNSLMTDSIIPDSLPVHSNNDNESLEEIESLLSRRD